MVSTPLTPHTVGPRIDPMSDPDLAADLAGLALRVEQRIAARRRAGEFPHGLEDELDRYVRAYASQEVGGPLAQDRARVAVRAAAARPAFSPLSEPGPSDAGNTRGRRLASRARRAAMTSRLAQVQVWRRSMEDAVVSSLEAIDRFEADGLPAARDALAMVLDRLGALTSLEDTVSDLEDRLTALEERLADAER